MKDLIRFSLTLLIICFIASGLLASVNLITNPKIEAQALKEQTDALNEVISNAETFEAVKKDGKTIYYKAYNENRDLVGFAFMTEIKGYSSLIKTMIGMDTQATITAIKILRQNETPGLGTKIIEVLDNTTIFDALAGKTKPIGLKSWFQAQFSDKNVNQLDQVETISGATISSRAVLDSVKNKCYEILELTKNGSS